MYCVILAGGAGTRFWPASTEEKPKQLLTLVGSRSLLQMAVDRAAVVTSHDKILIITGAPLERAVREQLPELPANNIVAEPFRRDTAAAIALAALIVDARTKGDRVAVLTADHLIGPTNLFADAVTRAAAAADDAAIITFGVVPSYPATGYGYLEVDTIDGDAVRNVTRFVEKPDVATATSYLASGRYLWNSGMFVFHTDAMLRALSQHLPEHVAMLAPAAMSGVVDDAALTQVFASLPKISIDKGVMEKHDDVRCVPARFSWSDVGSFPSLADHLPKDAHGNAHRGGVRTLDAHNNVTWCEDHHEEVAIIGVSDIVVVRAGMRTLVVPKARAEDVKKLVEG